MSIANKDLIQEALSRGIEKIYPTKKELEKVLLSGKKLKIYNGMDPSGPTLHLGHSIVLRKLRQFQDLGHKIILLIGDFTGMIGDPTDKTAARKKLTREQVLENCKNYKSQASKILNFSGKNPAELKFNSEWLDNLNFRELIELASNFTVQQMLERDMFDQRMKTGKPIYLHEFLYPLMQGYDCVAMDVDMEIGGSDQTFNMLAGRTLMKALKKKDKFVLTMKLLSDPTGKKMGKSEGNMISLDDTPNDMYGKIMSWPDEMIGIGFELLTNLPMEEVNEIERQLKKPGINPRDMKMRLAFEVVKGIEGEEAAAKAELYFIDTFQKKEAPKEAKEIRLDKDSYNVIDLLTQSGLVKSRSEAKRAVEQGGIKIDGKIIKDINLEVQIGQKSILVQKGKRHFIKIRL